MTAAPQEVTAGDLEEANLAARKRQSPPKRWALSLILLVGRAGFEPAASAHLRGAALAKRRATCGQANQKQGDCRRRRNRFDPRERSA